MDTELRHVAKIGEIAGMVWGTLAQEGPMSLSRLVKLIGEPRDSVMQALGWLAREGKVDFEDEGRTRFVSLT